MTRIVDVTCPHCKKRFSVNSWHRHNGRCLRQPEVFERIKKFLDTIAPDGGMPTTAIYSQLRAELMEEMGFFPDHNVLIRVFGSWVNAALTFGMVYSGPVKRMPDCEVIWAELRKWFNSTSAPYFAGAWDEYAKGESLPSSERIRKRLDLQWAEIVEKMEPCEIYPTRRPIDEITDYNPFGKITAERKSWAERAIAHIQDESERAREWFRLLGLPQPETVGEMGD